MKNTTTNRSIVFTILPLLAITIATLTPNLAFAAVPQFDTYVADDPDNGDEVFSNGDTLTITFNIATNATGNGSISKAEIDLNFTDGAGAPNFGTAYSGVWSADSTTLTITVTDVTGGALTIGVSTIAGAATTDIADADGGNGDLINVGGDTATLSGDFGVVVSLNTGGGDGCVGDCEEPTLGLDQNGVRLVENGFTYNGKPVDVERFFTPYPLITVKVGAQNLAEFKVYENEGPDNISHFDLAFGLASGQILSQSTARIEWDRTFDGTETITIIDPDNVLSDNVRVLTSEGKCSMDSLTDDCLIVKVYHTFRAPPEFNIVGTNVWDSYRNSWQNYYNHGIEVVGKSMNPPKQYQAMDRGHLVTITEIEKNHAVDENGNHWFFDKEWLKDYVPSGKIADPISTYHGIDRNHAYFETYLKGQQLVASHTLEQILGGKSIHEEPQESVSYDHVWISRSEDRQLQKTIKSEMIRAQQLYQTLYWENQ